VEEATEAGEVWQRKQAHRKVALHGGLAHLFRASLFQPVAIQGAYTKNSGRLPAALHF
jgi:hypothetical protein